MWVLYTQKVTYEASSPPGRSGWCRACAPGFGGRSGDPWPSELISDSPGLTLWKETEMNSSAFHSVFDPYCLKKVS